MKRGGIVQCPGIALVTSVMVASSDLDPLGLTEDELPGATASSVTMACLSWRDRYPYMVTTECTWSTGLFTHHVLLYGTQLSLQYNI